MTTFPDLDSRINLLNDRITAEDAERQARAAQRILERFERQPGVILADEVGMGKTFVALAVACSIALEREDADPIVIMTPPSLREKWPKDWEVFTSKCLPEEAARRLRCRSATTGVGFLRLLDDSRETRASVIFLTHGALSRDTGDSLVRLAIIKRALRNRRAFDVERRNLERFGARLLRMGRLEDAAPGLIKDLLDSPYARWGKLLPERYWDKNERDDPIPAHLVDALDAMPTAELEAVVEKLRDLPQRESSTIDVRLRDLRQVLTAEVERVWHKALTSARFRSPLLVLDEAHHVKNPKTRLSGLFGSPEAADDAAVIDRAGALGGKFERMLFLTATPFQLGHQELIRVLERFDGIDWQGPRAPALSRSGFKQELKVLAERLDDAQAAALRLDAAWSKLRRDDLPESTDEAIANGSWWAPAVSADHGTLLAAVARNVDSTSECMRAAEDALAPWVLRHVKPGHLSGHAAVARRQLVPGAGIEDGGRTHEGIGIREDVVLPFLLAARAQALLTRMPHRRAVFAEGLASSFEAYLETRAQGAEDARDDDAEVLDGNPGHDEDHELATELDWYLDHLDKALPKASSDARMSHPKVIATARRSVELWKQGEKVLIFCHYRATGRALRQHISFLLHQEILAAARTKLPGLSDEEIEARLEALGDRFSDEGPLNRAVGDWLEEVLADFPLEADERTAVGGIVRRFIRTPSFLVRYLPLEASDLVAAFQDAVRNEASPGGSLGQSVAHFCQFIAHRCTRDERRRYLVALDAVQTGTHRGKDIAIHYDAGEGRSNGRAILLPNVRLANGEVRHETRQRLLLTFNTPLFPEILIASSVMAEGVDLHLNCRHVIHHDLCWNPSTLEQRSGRVDRIGSKAERVGNSIRLYLPYVAATQDEKMYRVVQDRERWFQIVMGEKYESDEASTEKRAERIPLPPEVQGRLAMRLH